MERSVLHCSPVRLRTSRFSFLSSSKLFLFTMAMPRPSTSSSTPPEAVMPGDIKTEPHAKLVFNAPFSEKNRYPFTIANLGEHRIIWVHRNTNMFRLTVDPPTGVLDPKEQQMLFVTQETFSYETEDTNNDSITFLWINEPKGAAKQFQGEWHFGAGMVRCKNIPIEYKP